MGAFLELGELAEVDVELLEELLLLRDRRGDADETLPTGDGDLLLEADFVFLTSPSALAL